MIAIPSITPWLALCAVEAVDRTTDSPVRVICGPFVGTDGEQLDRAFSLVHDETWFVTLHDDAAPMQRGWLPWLLDRIGDRVWGGFWPTRNGSPHPAGAAYRVDWLRRIGGSFKANLPKWDTGEGFHGAGSPVIVDQMWDRKPLWLRGCDAAEDRHGRLIWAHLGGGTIGSTNWRMPAWCWPRAVRWAHRRLA